MGHQSGDLQQKTDPGLRKTPIVVFSTSQAGHDIVDSYALGANSYVHKPGNLHEFVSSVKSIEEFWFGCARPTTRNRGSAFHSIVMTTFPW